MIKNIALAILVGTCLACQDQVTITTQADVISDQRKRIASLERSNKDLEKSNLRLTSENGKLKASVESINCRIAEQIKFQQYLDSRRTIPHDNAY